jgi:hypothetical protein
VDRRSVRPRTPTPAGAAFLALATPRIAAVGPRGLFGLLTLLVVIGMAAAIFGFRNGSRNEFGVEAGEVDETGNINTSPTARH